MVNRATSHPEVNELLDALTDGLREILRDQLVGAYLFGSATTAPLAEDLSETWGFIRYAIERTTR